MSIKISALVRKLEIPKGEKNILLAYADHAHDDGTGIYPSIELIAKEASYHDRQTQVISRTLERKGLLVYVGRYHRANEWFIPLDTKGAEIAPLPLDVRCILPSRKVHSMTRKVHSTTLKGAENAPELLLTVNEPSINRETSKSSFEGQNLKPSTQEPKLSEAEKGAQLISGAEEVPADALVKLSELFKKKLSLDPVGKFAPRYEELYKYAYVRQKEHGENSEVFLSWWLAHNPDSTYWSPEKMITAWPQAFRGTEQDVTDAASDKYVEEDPAHPWIKTFEREPK